MTDQVPLSLSAALGPTDDEIPVALIRLDEQAGAVAVNDEWTALTGLTREASVGSGWLSAFATEQRAEVASLTARVLAEGGRELAEWQLARGDGTSWAAATMSAHRAGGRCTGTVALVDVTERRSREVDLMRRANHDPLTGLANRDVLIDRAEHALARLSRRPGLCAVLFLDFDHFKAVNDRFGHHHGDITLATLAQRLTSAMRAADTLARVGGDELVVLCEDLTTPDEAISVADRLLAAIRQPIDLGIATQVITASIGVAFANGPGASVTDLLHRADRAMYQAKIRGGNGCQTDVSNTGPVVDVTGIGRPDELTTAIAHLSIAADALDRLAASDQAGHDGARWMATDEASTSLHRSLILLKEAASGLADIDLSAG